MNYFEEIESYISGELDGLRLIDFENELKSNAELQEAVKDHKAIIARLNAFQLRNQVKKYTSKKNVYQPRYNIRYYAAAASIAVLVIAGYFFFRSKDSETYLAKTNTTDLKKNPVTPIENTNPIAINDTIQKENKSNNETHVKESNAGKLLAMAERYSSNSDGSEFAVRGEETDRELAVFDAYKNKEYKKVESLLRNDFKDASEEEQVLYTISLIKLKKFNEALTKLESIKESSSYPDEIQWHIMLCQLVNYNKNKSEVDKTLNDIIKSPNHQYYKKAVQLKSDLNKLK